MTAIAELPRSEVHETGCEDWHTVYDFWFPPGLDGADLETHYRMSEWWFRGGANADLPPFAPLVEAAAAGNLNRWLTSPLGRLSLIIVLDQFPRGLFAGTPKAFAFDSQALGVAEEGLRIGHYDALTHPWEKALFALPLIHAEGTDHLERAERSVALAEKRLSEGPPHLRPLREFGLSQARGHRDVISRFGRHPHRNAILGRLSTPEEAAYVDKGDFVHNRRPAYAPSSTTTETVWRPDRRKVVGDVARHYASDGLVERILTALANQGLDTTTLSAATLFPFDQLHGRQLEATKEQLAKLELDPSKHVVDVGSGIGGPARYMAVTHGCRVTGIDLTEEFVTTARVLTERCGLEDQVAFEHCDALGMPFGDESFDAASCLYVGMNVADRIGLLGEMRRVIKPGGRLVWTEVVQTADEPPGYPLPWAREPSVSFLVPPGLLRDAFAVADLEIIEMIDETAAHQAFVQQRQAAPPSPGRVLANRIVLGDDFGERLQNFNRSVDDGRLGTVLIVARRP